MLTINLSNTQKVVLSAFATFVFAFIVFYPATRCALTNWDDNYLVTENPQIRSLTLDNIISMFSSYSLNHYHPLVILSYALEFKFFGLSAYHFHLTNILLHALNASLAVLLAYLLSKNALTALIVGVLFAVHPLRVESVVWVAERKDVLCTFFIFLSLIHYIYHRDCKNVLYFFFALVFFVFALLSKALAVVVPLLFLLYDYYKDGKIEKHQFLQILPLLAISALFGVIAIIAQYSTGFTYKDPTFTIWKSVFLVFHSYLFYLLQFLIPIHLSPVHPYPELVGESYSLFFWASPLIAAFIVYGVYRYARHEKLLVFGLLFYFITLLPVTQFIPVGRMIVAERFSYVPLFGVMLVVAYYCTQLIQRVQLKVLRTLIPVFGIIILSAGLSSITRDYISVWCTNISLWTRVVNDNPRFAEGYNNLAVSLAEAGKEHEALQAFARAIELDPADEQIYYNRGLYFMKVKKYTEAINDFTAVLALNPSNLFAYIVRGDAYFARGEYTKALDDYSSVLSVVPKVVDVRIKRIRAYKELRDTSKVKEELLYLQSIGVQLDTTSFDSK